MSKKDHQFKSGKSFKRGIQNVLLMIVLFVYLLIPFKQQFLETIHLIDHLSQSQQIMHSHDHSHGETDHHHSYMAFHSDDNKDHHAEHPIPTELVNYQFQIPLPSLSFNIAEYIPLEIGKTFQMLLIPILNGPVFGVPQPPP